MPPGETLVAATAVAGMRGRVRAVERAFMSVGFIRMAKG